MVEEAASASSTYGIHSEIGYNPVPDNDNLAILPAYLDDGLHLGEIKQGSRSVAGNLIFD